MFGLNLWVKRGNSGGEWVRDWYILNKIWNQTQEIYVSFLKKIDLLIQNEKKVKMI